jgi:hypothetical protein
MRHLLLACLLAWSSTVHADVAKTIVRADAAGANLLKPDAWRTLAGVRQAGEPMVCDNANDAQARGGFVQTVVLNQTAPQPVIVSAWSKAENVGGSRDGEYALYLDIVYADGTPLWGQTAPFRTGTHDWQQAEVKLFPEKPIKTVSCNLLLRGHSGKALFRQPQLVQIESRGAATWFDGLLVQPKTSAAGFQVRDVAADSDFVTFTEGKALGLTLSTTTRRQGNVEFITGSLRDTTGKDRAVTLIYALPIAGDGWRWLAGPRREEVISPSREYLSAARIGAGVGRLSRYPLAAVANDQRGQAIGLDMDKPAIFRVGYSAGELYIAYDLALAAEKPGAEVSFCVYPINPAEGFRGAVAGYYAAFPEYFRCRTPRQGLWMPFNKISAVQGWEDFGFAFKEGNNETGWDDAHDIITFRYTEPMTWWMTMPKNTPRTLDAAVEYARQLAAKGDRNAQALLTSGHHDEAGQLAAQLRREPWCDGAVWSMNSSPAVAGDITDFKNKWNPQLRASLYPPPPQTQLDGEYVDSAEGYVTAELNFRREHFAAARTPLTFSPDTHQPAIFRGLIAYEYVRALADDLHPAGKLTMANSTPDHLCWLAPFLDVMGTEWDWNPGNQWRPMPDEELLYRRVLCGPKPYCFLMNTNFDNFSHKLVEKYMKRCLAYGMFPGFFSHNAAEKHYFSQPDLYNRDRDLFKKYVPLCKLVAEAGWQPITRAQSNDPAVYIERFGQKYLTVFNDSSKPRSLAIRFTESPPAKCRDLVGGSTLTINGGNITIRLEAEDVALLELQ